MEPATDNQSQDHPGGLGCLYGDHPSPPWRHSFEDPVVRSDRRWSLIWSLKASFSFKTARQLSQQHKGFCLQCVFACTCQRRPFFFVMVTVSSQRKGDRRALPLRHSKNKFPICPFMLLFWSHFLKDNALFHYFSVTSTPRCQIKHFILL